MGAPSRTTDWNGTTKMRVEILLDVLNVQVGKLISSDEENTVLSK